MFNLNLDSEEKMMKKWLNSNIVLYTLIVLLPTLISCYFYFQLLSQQDELDRINDSKRVGTIHQRYWDNFIGETKTSLKILSLTSLITGDSNEKIRDLLTKTHQTDPRFGGLYLLNSEGKVLLGSNVFLDNMDLSGEDYIQNVIHSKGTIISDNSEKMINHQSVVGLATPILNEHNELKGILLANLRIDYIANTMKVLSPEEKIKVISSNNTELISINTQQSIKNGNEWISVPIERLPWTINVKVGKPKLEMISTEFSKFILISFILTNIIFLLSKYLLLKRQAIRERAQNDAQKLELVGSLAASSAHEIRNPLTGIKGLVQLLSEKYKAEEDQYYFSVIENEIERINEIVSEFLILGKPTAQRMEKIDVRKILHEVEPLIYSEGNLHNIRCTMSISSEPIFVECTKDQMKQVILNITRNAFDSMEKEGHLFIELFQNADQCQLIITDTGTGIPKEDLKNIFVPFFTSKDTGTGLGLVVCKRIIQTFNGTIMLESQEGKGTKVIINLPIS
jgi:two-component system, sporulation sensor kinase D